MNYHAEDALIDAAALHSHPLFIVDCDAKRSCPECSRNPELRPLLCPPETCGTPDGKSNHQGIRGSQFTGVASLLLSRRQAQEALNYPDRDQTEALEGAVSPRPSAPARLF